MIDDCVHIRVRIHEQVIPFRRLTAGRCFVLAYQDDETKEWAPPKRPQAIYFKLNKTRAQRVDNELHRKEMSEGLPVCEVVLVVEEVKQDKE